MARIWKRQNVDQKFIAILLLKSENQFFVHSRKIPRDIYHCYRCPKKIKSCQSPNIHFFIISSNEDTAKKNSEKRDSFVVDIFFVQDMMQKKMVILTISFLSTVFSALSLFVLLIPDSASVMTEDHHQLKCHSPWQFLLVATRTSNAEESCSKFKTANKRLLEHLYLKTLFWHHE